MDIIINKRLIVDLEIILENYYFIKLRGKIILFWSLKKEERNKLLSRENGQDLNLINHVLHEEMVWFLSKNKIHIDSNYYIHFSENDTKKTFESYVSEIIDNIYKEIDPDNIIFKKMPVRLKNICWSHDITCLYDMLKFTRQELLSLFRKYRFTNRDLKVLDEFLIDNNLELRKS